MNIHHYETSGGKDLILNYIDELPKSERAEGLTILGKLEDEGLEALKIPVKSKKVRLKSLN